MEQTYPARLAATKHWLAQAPRLLAGPIVRRCGPDQLNLWVATNRQTRVLARVHRYEARGRRLEQVGQSPSPAPSREFGKHLHITLFAIPSGGGNRYPVGEPLGYELEFEFESGRKTQLTELLPKGIGQLVYKPFDLPTIVLGTGELPTFAHASCRKFHGKEKDAMARLDEELQNTIERTALSSRASLLKSMQDDQRPTTLFLTGDQIYADDVPEPLIDTIMCLAEGLMGFDELIPNRPNPHEPATSTIAGFIKASQMRCGLRPLRLQVLRGESLTSDLAAGRNQLIAFGEFAATYLLAWADVCWPESLPTRIPCATGKETNEDYEERHAQETKDRTGKRVELEYDKQLERVNQYRETVPAMRRLLANVTTYMIMDDHEVTDDWNINGDWADIVREDPMTARLVKNAMTAFWCFQGEGNDPREFRITEVVSRYLRALQDNAKHIPPTGAQSRDWTFVAPTLPPVLVLDTRTQREFGKDRRAVPRLMNDGALSRARTMLRNANGGRGGFPLLVISPKPVFEPWLVTWGQEYFYRSRRGELTGHGRYKYDPEAWGLDPNSLAELLTGFHDFNSGTCIFLSGDVHYGCVMEGRYEQSETQTRFIQFTSSGARNDADDLQFAARFEPRSGALDLTIGTGASGGAAPVPLKSKLTISFPEGGRPMFDRNVGILDFDKRRDFRCRLLRHSSDPIVVKFLSRTR
jgi:hypothetical protein